MACVLVIVCSICLQLLSEKVWKRFCRRLWDLLESGQDYCPFAVATPLMFVCLFIWSDGN